MLVVAGVLVDGNTQWKPLREALDELRREYIAPEHASHFKAFHATDMFHGSGKVFGQNIRPLEESRSALLEVIKLPSRFQLPVAFGYVPKSDTPASLKTPSQVRKSAAEHHALAALFCLLMADGYLKGRCPNDVVWALAEDNTQHKKVVNEIKAMAEKAGKDLKVSRDSGTALTSLLVGDLEISLFPDTFWVPLRCKTGRTVAATGRWLRVCSSPMVAGYR